MAELAYAEPVAGMAFEDIRLGMQASLETSVTDGDIQSFAVITGDRNPVHLEAE